MYKNDLMDKILNEKIYKATENTEVSDAAKILFRVEDMNDEARRNLKLLYVASSIQCCNRNTYTYC